MWSWGEEPPPPPSEYTTTHKLAHLFHVRPYREIELELFPQIDERREAIIAEALEAGHSREAALNLAEEETIRMMDAVFIPWHEDLMSRVKDAFERFHLDLEEEPSGSYKIKPAEGKTWSDAAQALAETFKKDRYRGLHKNEVRMIKKHPRDFVLSNLWSIANWGYLENR
jgi:hypothetical protein